MTIDVEIYGKDMNVTERIEEYVNKRASRLDRYLSGIDNARVDLANVKSARNASDRQVAQITVRGKRFILRSEERSDDIITAFDSALDKIQRQISRYKGKHYRGRGDGTSLAEYTMEMMEDEFEEEEPIIARRKRFTVYPMNELEAIEQMKLLGHEDFFIFYNAETSSINVLYKRRDDSYGIIQPEVG